MNADNNNEGRRVELSEQFRYMQFRGGARSVWYDDIVIAPDRVGCN